MLDSDTDAVTEIELRKWQLDRPTVCFVTANYRGCWKCAHSSFA